MGDVKYGKREPRQLINDLAVIARLYLQGLTYAAILDELQRLNDKEQRGVQYSVHMVHRDVARIRKSWRESAVRDFDAAKAEQLARLDLIESQAWEQWRRSCENVVKRTEGQMSNGEVDYTVTYGQCGDPRYLATVLSVVERRCKILGLDAPQKVAPTDPTGTQPFAPMSDEEADKRIEELLVKLGYANPAGVH